MRNRIMVAAGLTAISVYYAYLSRGYMAIGGEWFVPLIVMAAYKMKTPGEAATSVKGVRKLYSYIIPQED